ncbi:hypothetical protein OS965_36595 [Streptomyces sp. H27-G5]|uniref:hypothetical protein n=1 Tax=Streptomyces sp. H27-G5 TaxID=2996698 RepID=UPI00226E3E70|nr:hypothetical protein [Streptomyces sp. H27-G5]MCY0923600.1 hypothetical protein [Streptomyces sp. H27-G5]
MATAPLPRGEEPLSDDELAVLAVTLILSGNDTATCRISDIAYLLLTRPEQRAVLTREPARIPRAVEELLRFIPFREGVGIPRLALADVEIEGTVVRPGDYVHVSYRTTLWHLRAPLSAIRSSVGSAVGLRRKRVLRPLDGFEVLEDEEDPEALGRPRVNPDSSGTAYNFLRRAAPSRHEGSPRRFTS